MAKGRRKNPEAEQRARIARYFHRCLKELGISSKEVSRELGIDPQTVKRLPNTVPQLRILCPLGSYIQERSRAEAHS
jgi:DNA invertase Pin-like site-specific DNA recombinase